MKIKDGASLQGIHPCMRPALRACQVIMGEYGVDFVVTSGTDGTHSSGSLHYYGFAFDARTRDLKDVDKHAVASKLRARLPDFDVILENTHIHIENEKVFRELHSAYPVD